MSKKEKIGIGEGYFDRPEVKKRLWLLLWGACILSVAVELFLHRHGHFGEHSIDSIFGFYAILGFLACLLCILVAKFLGEFLKVNPDYYDDELH
jgi:hypothetical protein